MDKKDPSDERKEKSSIHEETVCCEDGACNWHDNTLAQSEGDKGGGYRDKAV
jgi:hypothetical protein